MKAFDGKLSVLTHDNSLSVVGADGKLVIQKAVAPGSLEKLAADLRPTAERLARPAQGQVAAGPHRQAHGHAARGDGGGLLGRHAHPLRRRGRPTSRQQLPQDVTALAWFGDTLAVGLADGRVVALAAK